MEDNKRKLYDALSQEYDLGSFEQFSADIADDTKRRKLYDATSEEYDYGDYNSFSKQLGFGVEPSRPTPRTEQVERVEQPARTVDPQAAAEGRDMFNRMVAERRGASTLADAQQATQDYLNRPLSKADKDKFTGKAGPSLDEMYLGAEQMKQGAADVARKAEEAIENPKLSRFNELMEKAQSTKLMSADEYREMNDLYSAPEVNPTAQLKAAIARRNFNNSPEGEFVRLSQQLTKLNKNSKEYEAVERAWKESEFHKTKSDGLKKSVAELAEKTRESLGMDSSLYTTWFKMMMRNPATNPSGVLPDTHVKDTQAATSRMLAEAAKILNDPSKYDDTTWLQRRGRFAKEYGKEMANPEMWLKSVFQAEDSVPLRNVFGKIAEHYGNVDEKLLKDDDIDNILDEDEKNLLRAYFMLSEAQTLRPEVAGYIQSARSAANSTKFIIEMAISGEALGFNALEKKLYDEGAKKLAATYLAKWAEKQIVWDGTFALAAKAGQAVTKLAGKSLLTYATSYPAVLFHPTTWGDFAERMSRPNEDGEYDPDVLKEAWGAVRDNQKERWTETLGETVFNEFLGSAVRGLGIAGRKAVGDGLAGKWVDEAAERFADVGDYISSTKPAQFIKKAANSSWGQKVRQIAEATHFDGIGPEIGEEGLGAAIDAFRQKSAEPLRDFFTWDNLIMTGESFLPMYIWGGGFSAAGLAASRIKYGHSSKKLENLMKRYGYSDEQVQYIFDQTKGAAPAEISRLLADMGANITNSRFGAAAAVVIDDEQVEIVNAFKDYLRDSVEYNTYDAMREEQEAEQREVLKRELEENYGHKFYIDADENNPQRVIRARVNDGKGGLADVFILDDKPGTNGRYYAMYPDGQMGWIGVSDMAPMTDEAGNPVLDKLGRFTPSFLAQTMDAFLSEQVMAQRQAETAVDNANRLLATNATLMDSVKQIEDNLKHNGKDGYLVRSDERGAEFRPFDDDGKPGEFVPWAQLAVENGITTADAPIPTAEDEVEAEGESMAQAVISRRNIAELVNLEGENLYTIELDGKTYRLIYALPGSVDAVEGRITGVFAGPNGERRAFSFAYDDVLNPRFEGEDNGGELPKAEAQVGTQPAPAEQPQAPAVEETPAAPEAGFKETKDYYKPGATVDDVYTMLGDLYGNEDLLAEEVDEEIQNEYKRAEKASNNAQKALDDANPEKIERQKGESLPALAARRKAARENYEKVREGLEQKLQDAESELAFWEEAKKVVDADIQERKAAVKEEAERQKRIEQYGIDTRELEKETEPRSLDEAIADALNGFFNGGGFLNYQDVVDVTGLDERSLLRQGWKFVLKKDGISIDDFVHNILAGDPQTAGFVKDEQEAINKVGELLQTMSRGELGKLIFNNRLKEAIAAKEYAEGALELEQQNGASAQGGYQLSDEVDDNGRQFVLTKNGELEFGDIPAESGLTAAPILLSEGMITNPATNDGYGLVHIEARHGEQIRNAGYDSVIVFIEEVAKNYQIIRKGKERDGVQTYMLQLTDKHNNTLMVELSGDGTYYTINTAGVFKTSYGAKNNVVYNRPASGNQPAETDEATPSGEQSGTQSDASGNTTSTQQGVSTGKDTDNSEENNTPEDIPASEAVEEAPEGTEVPEVEEPVAEPAEPVAPTPEEGRRNRLDELQKRVSIVQQHPNNLRAAYESGDVERIASAEKAMSDFINSSDSILLLRGTENVAKDRRKKADKGSAEYKLQDFILKAIKKRIGQLDKTAVKAYDDARAVYEDRFTAEKDALESAIAYFQGELETAQELLDNVPEGTNELYVANLKNRVSSAKRYVDVLTQELNRFKEEEEKEPKVKNELEAEVKEPEKPAEKPAQKAAKASTDEKIEDFGEKIGGARKDTYRAKIRDAVKLTAKDLSTLKDPDKILSRKKIISLMEEGAMSKEDGLTLLSLNMAVRSLSDTLGMKTLGLMKYRDLASAWEAGKELKMEITDADIDFLIEQKSDRVKALPNIREKERTSLEVLFQRVYNDYRATYEALNYPAVNRALKSAYIRPGTADGRYWVVGSPSSYRGWPFPTMEQAVAKMETEYPEIKKSENSSSSTEKGNEDKVGNLLVAKDDLGYYRIKSRSIPGKIYLSKKFYTRREAEQFLKDNAASLVDREQRMVDALLGSNIGIVQREGRDYRNGADVTPDQMLETFGFRGVEFGNWVPQAERQEYLNKTYDAIMDFCDIVGISPKAFSLGGRLGLAFGARGHSRALAHYEPMKEVINLTRMKGAGSLAHEWFHALDNYLAKQKTGNTSDMATDTKNVVREEMAQAFRDFVGAMNQLDYSKRSRRAGDYWGKVWERAARLFESYVYNELAGKSVVSPLLVSKDTLFDDVQSEDNSASSWPYPSIAENEQMKPFFDKLFETIEEKVDENGVVVLATDRGRYVIPESEVPYYYEYQERLNDAGDNAIERAKVLQEYYNRVQSDDYHIDVVPVSQAEEYLRNQGLSEEELEQALGYIGWGSGINLGNHAVIFADASRMPSIAFAWSAYVHEKHMDTANNPTTVPAVREAYGNTEAVDDGYARMKQTLARFGASYKYFTMPAESLASEIMSRAIEVAYGEENFADILKNEYLVPDKVIQLVKDSYEQRNSFQRADNTGQEANVDGSESGRGKENGRNGQEVSGQDSAGTPGRNGEGAEGWDGIVIPTDYSPKNRINDEYDDNGTGSSQDAIREGERNGSDTDGQDARKVEISRDKGRIRVLETEVASSQREYPIGSDRDYARRVDQENEGQRLIDAAKANGLFIEPGAYSHLPRVNHQSRESVVYHDVENGRAIKIMDPFAAEPMTNNSPFDELYRHIVHNIYFPESRYEFLGITTNARGDEVRFVLSQPWIESYERVWDAEADNFIKKHGFGPFNGYKRQNDDVLVFDFYGSNIRKDADGNIYLIDPLISFKRDPRTIIDEYLGESVMQGQPLFREGDFTGAQIAAMETPILQSKGTFNTLAEAEAWAKENLQGQSRTNKFTGDEISIGRKSVKEMLGEKATKGSVSIQKHLAALQSILDFIETGIPGEIHKDTHGRGFDVMRLFNAIEIDGKLYRVKSTVRKVRNGDRYYTYEVQEMELMEERRANRESEEQGSVTTDNSNNSITGAKLLKDVKKTNSSENILDDNDVVAQRLSVAELEATNATLDRMSEEMGIKINRVGRSQIPRGHKSDKGYYNPSTGEMTICMDNVTDERDAIATVLHETVGHHGLRKLFGDRFNDAMARIYTALDKKGKTWVNGYIARHPNADNTRAVEEYLSHLAESGDFKNTVWDNIRRIIGRIVDALFGTNGFLLTDNELNYILRASYENLKTPNWLNTVEGRAFDTLLKRQLGINETDPDRPTDPQGLDSGRLYRDGDTGVANDDYNREVDREWNKALTENQDADVPVRIGMDKVMKEKGIKSISEDEDYVTRHNLASSRAESEAHEFELFRFTPLMDQVRAIQSRLLGKKATDADRQQAYERILDYMYAVSGLERNASKNTEIEQAKQAKLADAAAAGITDPAKLAEIEKKYDDMKRDWSGLTSLMGMSKDNWQAAETAAQGMISAFEGAIGDKAALDELWNRVRACTDFSLEHAYQHGLLTREEFERLHGTASQPRMWEYYLPFRGFSETTAEEQFSYETFTNPSRGNVVVKKMNGRWTQADNPLANILNIVETEIVQGNDNWAKQALYRFTLNAGDNTLLSASEPWFVKNPATGKWSMAFPDQGETLEEFEERMNALRAIDDPLAKKGRRGLKLENIMANKAHHNEHAIHLKVGGIDKMIWVNGNPALAKAVSGIGRAQNLQWLRRASRALSNLFTTYSLDFTAKNLIRDTVYSNIALYVKEDKAYRHQYHKNWIANFGYGAFAYPMVRLAAEWDSGELQRKEAAGTLTKREQDFLNFMRDGGQTGYTIVNSVRQIKKDLEKQMRSAGGRPGTVPILGWYAKSVKTINEGFELLTRFTAYQTSRDMGRSGQRAASDAKEISVNFNRRGAQSGEGFWGNIAAYLGATHYFYNAGVQGFDNFLGLFKKKPVKMSAITAGFVMMGIVTPFINSMLAGLVGGGEGDDDWYWNLPEWVRRNNLIIGTGKFYVAIPLPVEFRAPYGIGDIAGSAFAYDKYPNRHFGNVAGDLISTASGILPVNPIEGYNSNGNIGDAALRAVAPDAGMFFVDWATNRDYTGRPLWKENPFSDNVPRSQGAYASTPKGIVAACQKLAEVSNGNIDIAPGLVRDFMQNYGGGFFRAAEDVSKLLFTDEERPRRWDNVPFFSGFTGHIDEDRSNSFAQNALYEYKKLSEGNVKDMNAILNTDDVTSAVLYDNPETLYDREGVTLVQKAKIKRMLDSKDYALGKIYREGVNNEYKMKQRMTGAKAGQWYKSREVERKGVNALRQDWKDLRDQWASMPDKTAEEKSAKAKAYLDVQEAWHLYYDAMGNLAEKLMDYEYNK